MEGSQSSSQEPGEAEQVKREDQGLSLGLPRAVPRAYILNIEFQENLLY